MASLDIQNPDRYGIVFQVFVEEIGVGILKIATPSANEIWQIVALRVTPSFCQSCSF